MASWTELKMSRRMSADKRPWEQIRESSSLSSVNEKRLWNLNRKWFGKGRKRRVLIRWKKRLEKRALGQRRQRLECRLWWTNGRKNYDTGAYLDRVFPESEIKRDSGQYNVSRHWTCVEDKTFLFGDLYRYRSAFVGKRKKDLKKNKISVVFKFSDYARRSVTSLPEPLPTCSRNNPKDFFNLFYFRSWADELYRIYETYWRRQGGTFKRLEKKEQKTRLRVQSN